MAHKVTFRFDEEEWEILRRIAETAGVSVTGLVQAAAGVWGSNWEQNDWALPDHWPVDPLRQAWVTAIERARQIDAERRARPREASVPNVTVGTPPPPHNGK